MSEIEKAREALATQTYWADIGEFSQAETEADAIINAARAIAREEIEAALNKSPATPSLTGDQELDMRLRASIRWFNSLPAEQQEEHLRKQRESWVRGEMGLGPDNKRATINQEGGDRNQLDRRQDREDKSPPAVEAPAAGDCPHCNGSGFIIPDTRTLSRIPKCPRCYGTGKAEDVGPRNAAEASAMAGPAAGDLQPFGGITIRADEPNIVIEGLGRPDLSIGGELSDMTALARRLAEALNGVWVSGDPERFDRVVVDALAEARKHKLIE